MDKKSVEVVGIRKGNLFVNESKLTGLVHDIEKHLNILDESLMDVSVSINKLVNQKVIKGNKIDAYKSLSKKAKAQSIAAHKFKETLMKDYEKDLQFYPITILDERIAELERKIASLVEE